MRSDECDRFRGSQGCDAPRKKAEMPPAGGGEGRAFPPQSGESSRQSPFARETSAGASSSHTCSTSSAKLPIIVQLVAKIADGRSSEQRRAIHPGRAGEDMGQPTSPETYVSLYHSLPLSAPRQCPRFLSCTNAFSPGAIATEWRLSSSASPAAPPALTPYTFQ